jgi:hypothetical protein
MTMPAIAPPPSPFFFSGIGVGVVELLDTGAFVAELDALEICDEELLVIEELAGSTLLDTMLTAPPNFCGNETRPIPDLQHALLWPQHQRSLSALPVQGVTWMFDPPPRASLQMSRQFPDVKFESVQKFAKKLDDVTCQLYFPCEGHGAWAYYDFSTPSCVFLFWHNPLGRHSSFVSPFFASPPAGFVRFDAQHIVDGPPDEQGSKALKKPPSEGRTLPSGEKHCDCACTRSERNGKKKKTRIVTMKSHRS